MRLSLQTQHFDSGDALPVYVEDRLKAVLGKYFGDALNVQVAFCKEGAHTYRASIQAHIAHGLHIEAQGEGKKVYDAFDEACTHFSKRLRRRKRLLQMKQAEKGIVKSVDTP